MILDSAPSAPNRRLPMRFLSHLPENPEFIEVCCLVAPTPCMCFDPNLIRPGTSLQICECNSVGDGLLGTTGSGRLPSVNSNLVILLIVRGPLVGSRSTPVVLPQHVAPADFVAAIASGGRRRSAGDTLGSTRRAAALGRLGREGDDTPQGPRDRTDCAGLPRENRVAPHIPRSASQRPLWRPGLALAIGLDRGRAGRTCGTSTHRLEEAYLLTSPAS
jgi:hypothetical protein